MRGILGRERNNFLIWFFRGYDYFYYLWVFYIFFRCVGEEKLIKNYCFVYVFKNISIFIIWLDYYENKFGKSSIDSYVYSEFM